METSGPHQELATLSSETVIRRQPDGELAIRRILLGEDILWISTEEEKSPKTSGREQNCST